jgi:uncharacterized protein
MAVAEKGMTTVKIRLRIGKSRIHGTGLFAAQPIPKGIRIIQYIGERIPKVASAERLAHGNVYLFSFNDRYDIDGKTLQNTARYINHSCDPNCEIQTTSRALWIVALRDITEGEELTYRYDYEYDPDGYVDFPCYCGAKNCVGYIVDARYWELITQQKYESTA